MRCIVLFIVLFRFATAAAVAREAAAATQEFSAILVVTPHGESAPSASGGLYVSGGRVRIETPDFPDGFFLVDTGKRTALFLRPARQMVMDSMQTSPLTQLLVPLDPASPCVQWRQMAQIAGLTDSQNQWQCRRLEAQAGDPSDTIRYQAIGPRGSVQDILIDVARRFPVFLRMADGSTVELRDFHDGPPPPGLFDVPAGFRKFDPRQLIERLKQSDVWLPPPP